MILLLIAILPIREYGFYVLLRWIVCLTAIYLAYCSYQIGKHSWTWMMGIIASIFNPIMPFHLGKNIWAVIDFVVAIVFGITFLIFRKARIEG